MQVFELSQTAQAWVAIATVVAMFIMFVRERYPTEVVAIGGVAFLLFMGVLPYDAGLAVLAGLDQLESLQLQQTEISDAGLDNLRKLAKLKTLDLTVTFVSPEAAKKLQAALPGCEVQW